jgi:gas vesicle protein GvpA/GvpJ/GvpM family
MSPRLPKRSNPRRPPRHRAEADEILGPEDASLLDIVDNLLNKGVVLNGDLTIALAQVDLIYARLSLLLSAADRVLPGEDPDFLERHHARHVRRQVARRRARA